MRSSSTNRRIVFTWAIALLLGPARGYCWGDEGHQIVALIADHYLLPQVRHRAAALLAADRSGLTPTTWVAESLWADRYRDADRDTSGLHYRQTRAWHFINIEVDAPDIDAACFGHTPPTPVGDASRGPAQACIVDKIVEFSHELARPATAAAERRLALQFLVHLVGDVHQPLHAADRHDHGGNDLRVADGTTAAGTLHHYWDTVFVERLAAPLGTPAAVARHLIAGISRRHRREWSNGTPRQWALQCFEIGRDQAYGRLPLATPAAAAAGSALALDPAYEAAATEAVAVQLTRAGLRLARLLNDSLRAAR